MSTECPFWTEPIRQWTPSNSVVKWNSNELKRSLNDNVLNVFKETDQSIINSLLSGKLLHKNTLLHFQTNENYLHFSAPTEYFTGAMLKRQTPTSFHSLFIDTKTVIFKVLVVLSFLRGRCFWNFVFLDIFLLSWFCFRSASERSRAKWSESEADLACSSLKIWINFPAEKSPEHLRVTYNSHFPPKLSSYPWCRSIIQTGDPVWT